MADYYMVVPVDAYGCWLNDPETFDFKCDALDRYNQRIAQEPGEAVDLVECRSVSCHEPTPEDRAAYLAKHKAKYEAMMARSCEGMAKAAKQQ